MPGLVLMTKPFEHVLGLIPKGVLAGLFVSLGHPAASRSNDSGTWAQTLYSGQA